MTHEDAFLQDILENREDDTPRRIYADWLLDHDDVVLAARGEFIHIQCDLTRLPATASRAQLLKREKELLEAHGREWGSLFQRLGCHCWEYRRGFVEGVGMPAQAFLAGAATLFRGSPIGELKLYGASSAITEIAHCPFLGRLRTLDLERNELGDAEVEILVASAHLEELTTLLLWCNLIGDASLAALARARLPRLLRLDLSRNGIGDAGAVALANSPLFGQLHLLDLTSNQIGDRGALTLAGSSNTSHLGWLDLTKNPISPTAQQALRERFGTRVQVWN